MAKEIAMRSTAFVLSLVMLTSACRADAPPPGTQSSQQPLQQPAANSGAVRVGDGAVRAGGFGGGGQIVIDGNAANGPGWVMVRRADAQRPTEKGSYLGLSVSPVPTVLRDQLKLQRGV